MRIALASCSDLPEPDPDRGLLVEELERAGGRAEWIAWDDPGADVARFDACVLRSTWNYYRDLPAFLSWARRAAAVTLLLNPLAAVEWNVHKRYLIELAREGIPVVPTLLVKRGDRPELARLSAQLGAEDLVIKPAVSASSFSTRRFRAALQGEGERFLLRLAAERDALVQPYMRSVERPYGERAVVWIDGRVTHAVRKSRRLDGDDERVSGALEVDHDERRLAERVLATRRDSLLYARVDVVQDEQGARRVAELELVEPSLFLAQHRPALSRLAAAIVARARAARAMTACSLTPE